jgi:mRNA-degrading endonuclease RelE of RelBE toxin-antitoxin system
MEFRIADTFVDSLAKLNNQEQKAVKTTVFDLQVNPASPGLSFHKLDHIQDPNFASVRVSSDLRLIVHQAPTCDLLRRTTTRPTAGPSGASSKPIPPPARRSWSRSVRRCKKLSFPPT